MIVMVYAGYEEWSRGDLELRGHLPGRQRASASGSFDYSPYRVSRV